MIETSTKHKPMTTKASDSNWTQLISDRDHAQKILKELQSEIKDLKRFIAEGWFEDAFTENEMKKELKRLEAFEEELVDALFQDLFDLL